MTIIYSLHSHAGEFATQANENPFLAGELNPQYEGELTALGGVVISHLVVDNKNIYQLDLGIENVKAIWVSSVVNLDGKQKIENGDKVVFKGVYHKS